MNGKTLVADLAQPAKCNVPKRIVRSEHKLLDIDGQNCSNAVIRQNNVLQGQLNVSDNNFVRVVLLCLASVNSCSVFGYLKDTAENWLWLLNHLVNK